MIQTNSKKKGALAASLNGHMTNNNEKDCILIFDGESFVLERVHYYHHDFSHEVPGDINTPLWRKFVRDRMFFEFFKLMMIKQLLHY